MREIVLRKWIERGSDTYNKKGEEERDDNDDEGEKKKLQREIYNGIRGGT